MDISTEDLFLFKPGEGAVMVFPGGKLPLEMLWVLSPRPGAFPDEATAEASFNVVPFRRIAVRADRDIHAHQSLARCMVTGRRARQLCQHCLRRAAEDVRHPRLRACIHASSTARRAP
ncbi:MAG: hypothetical protein ACLRI7_11560 [Ruthenibacterium lactatiformans]